MAVPAPSSRPLYGRFAWAYDLVVDRPAGPRPERVAALLEARGVPAGASAVDAGCGTGRHAGALAALGFEVVGIDRSQSLIEQAHARRSGARFACEDLLDFRPARAVAAVLCRGVLNDLLTEAERAGALASFASWLAPGGSLVADVREWDATRRRYAGAPPYVRTVARGQDELTFTSETTFDPARHLMLMRERYTGVVGGVEVEDTHDFTMRCWTSEEAHGHGTAAGFATVGLEPGPTADRLLILAER